MTIVAWDGKSIAADRQSTCVGLKETVTKIKVTDNGTIMAATGSYGGGLILMDWYDKGAKAEDYPSFQQDDDKWCRLIVFESGQQSPQVYEQHPVPLYFQDKFQAWGSGRDYALGAMAAGATAEEAVKITNAHCIDCGLGVDSIPLIKPHLEMRE